MCITYLNSLKEDSPIIDSRGVKVGTSRRFSHEIICKKDGYICRYVKKETEESDDEEIVDKITYGYVIHCEKCDKVMVLTNYFWREGMQSYESAKESMIMSLCQAVFEGYISLGLIAVYDTDKFWSTYDFVINKLLEDSPDPEPGKSLEAMFKIEDQLPKVLEFANFLDLPDENEGKAVNPKKSSKNVL